jgi:hypothetical protein
MTAICLVGLALAVFPLARAHAQAGADGDVGYSVGPGTPPPKPQQTSAGREDAGTAESKPQAPKLSITLEGYGKKDEPAPAPEPAAPVRTAPAPAPPAGSAPDQPPAAGPRQGQQPAGRQDSPPAVRSDPAPARVPAGRPSPVLAMLESTLGGRYANTKALARNMPQKHFERIGDKALARKLSKQGNDLLNKKDDPPAALAAYQSAYANDPSSSEITGSYGYALFRNGRFAEARDMETQCLELAPEYAAAWFVLGQIYGYLKQEDMAYASFVNTCLFTKNISTSLGFLEREIVKYGEVTVQQAAARALTACRSLSSEGPAARPAPAEPAPMRQGAGQAAPPAAPAGAGAQWKNARIGKVDIQAAIMDSKLFQSMISKMSKMPKSQIDGWLDSQLGPVIVELQGILRKYASENNFLLIIKSEDEKKVRGGGSLRTSLGGLVEDDDFVAYLDTAEGRAYRSGASIQDLTPVVAAKLGPR